MAAAIPAVARANSTDGGASVGQAAKRGRNVQVVSRIEPRIAVPVPSASDVAQAVNDARARVGLRELRWNDKVAASTQIQADYLASINRSSHLGPKGDAGGRLRAVGFRPDGWGEAVSIGFDDAQALVQAWLSSPGHKEILLGAFNYVGVARSNVGDRYVFVLVAANGS